MADKAKSSSTVQQKLLLSLLLIVIFALGGTTIILWKKVHDLTAQEVSYDADKSTLLQKERHVLQQHQQQLTDFDARLKAITHQVSTQAGPTPWTNASHFVEMASYQLNYLHNAQGGIEWLTQAKQSLAGLNDDKTAAIARRIDQEINALENHSSWQIDQLLVQLQQADQLISQLHQLTQPQPEVSKPSDDNDLEQVDSSDTSPSGKLKQFAERTQRYLRQLVVIENHAPAAELSPMTSRQHQRLVRYLRANIQQAQWAVMYQQPKFYQSNIRSIQRMLRKIYNADNPQVQQLQSLLAQLDTADITPSHIELNDILSKLHQAQRAANKAALPPADSKPTADSTSQPKLPSTSGVI